MKAKMGKKFKKEQKGLNRLLKVLLEKRQDKVWVKDNQLVNEGTKGAVRLLKVSRCCKID